MRAFCEPFGKSKQAYYKYEEQHALMRAAVPSFAVEYAEAIRQYDPGMGIMKVWYMYQQEFRFEEEILGRDAFTDLLVESGMKVRQKMRKPRTTDSTHGLPTFPDIIKDFIPAGPNQLWVSDMTYIPILNPDGGYRFCYLSLILDAYIKEIVGWSVGDSLRTEYPIEALEMAMKRLEGKEYNLIHHSDRGCQYASLEYVKILRDNNIRISMTESGDPKENAQAERINNTMKNELLKGKIFKSIRDVIIAVADVLDFYNNRRPHMSIDMMTPVQATICTGALVKKWHSYREEAIHAKLDIPEKSLPLACCQGSPSGLRPPVNP